MNIRDQIKSGLLAPDHPNPITELTKTMGLEIQKKFQQIDDQLQTMLLEFSIQANGIIELNSCLETLKNNPTIKQSTAAIGLLQSFIRSIVKGGAKGSQMAE